MYRLLTKILWEYIFKAKTICELRSNCSQMQLGTVFLWLFLLLFLSSRPVKSTQEQEFTFSVEGIGELGMPQKPENLYDLVEIVEQFCTKLQYTLFQSIPEHRCEWLVGASILESLEKKEGSTYVQKEFLRLDTANKLFQITESSLPSIVDLRKPPKLPSVLFLLHDAIPQEKDILNGGTQSIMEVAAGLATLGQMKVKVACLSGAVPVIESAYPNIRRLNLLVGYDNFSDFVDLYVASSLQFDSLVATYFVTVWMLKALILRIEGVSSIATPNLFYFVQDYESWFPLPASYKYAAMLSYFALPNHKFTICTYSLWVDSMLRKFHNIGNRHIDSEMGPYFNVRIHHVETHPISINGAVSSGRSYKSNKSNFIVTGTDFEMVRVGVMIRPHTPRRAPEMSINMLNHFARLAIPNLEFHTFGCSLPTFNKIFPRSAYANRSASFIRHHGILGRNEMVALLRRIHVFVDLSIWQAFGYTAFEGMSNGVVPVMKQNSGLSRYIVNNTNGLLISEDDSCNDSCTLFLFVNAIRSLTRNKTLLSGLSKQARFTASQHNTYNTTRSWMAMLANT